MFSYRALSERTGLVYDMQPLAARDLERAVIAIVEKADEARHTKVYVVTTNRFVANVLARFGVEFPKSLAVPNTRYLVGRFDLTSSSNRANVDKLAA